MLNLFFSPAGQIGHDDFYKGAAILLAVNFFAWPLWYVDTGLGFLAGCAALASSYCWFCLFAKRLKAANYSPLVFLMLWGIFVTATTILIFFTTALRLGTRASANPQLLADMEAIQTMDKDNPDIELVTSVYGQIGEVIIVPSAVIFFLVGLFMIRIFNKTLNMRT